MKTGRNAFVVSFLMLILAWPAAAAAKPVAKGPLRITGQTPLQTLRLDIVPHRPYILSPGQLEVSSSNSWTNRWNQSDYYFLDLEVIQNNLGIAVGIGGNAEVEVNIPVITRLGGVLDSFISRFHNRFGLGQDGRDLYPENMLLVKYTDPYTGEQTIILDRSNIGSQLGDVSILSRVGVYRGRGWLRTLDMTVLLRFPTSSERELYGSGGTDGAVSLATSHHFSSFFVYTTIGYGIYGSGSLYGIALRPYQWTFFTAVEWPVSHGTSVVLQLLSNSGATSDISEFSRPTHEMVVGAKQRLSNRLLLEYGITENMFIFNNSIDFGLNLGLTYTP